MTISLLLFSVAFLIIGGALCAVIGTRWSWANVLGGAVAVVAAVPAMIAAGQVMYTGQTEELIAAWSVPFGSFHVAMDGLSAFFILVIALISGLASVYGVSYLKPYADRKNLGINWFFYNALFASMLLLVVARNGVLFLFAWELMSLASFFLVMFEHERQDVREAGWTYLAATHLGTAFLFALFLLLGCQSQTMEFDAFSVPAGSTSASLLFLFAVIGFGTKAGFMPMHVWLPEAHPAAPSHVSAVMSGVMIKTGIYGLLRTLTFLGAPDSWPSWWGWMLVGVGAVSGIGGVLFALAQQDIKRLLAYSSVENIGIICMGMGLWLLGSSTGHPSLATLGLLGAMLHVWNHATFKSLLFLGAGAVAHATHTLNMELLGGLLKRMRYTGLFFFAGSVAICGLPPLNGFVSEFLLYIGAFTCLTQAGQSHVAVAGLVVVGALALIGGLAIACFSKVFGIVFLGEGRSSHAEHAHETTTAMRLPMAVLAGLCLLIPILGPLVIHAIGAQFMACSLLPAAVNSPDRVWDVAGLLWNVNGVFVVLCALIAILWFVRCRLLSSRTVEKTGTWDCGYAAPSPRMQYTASSYARPILDMFRCILRPRVLHDLPSGHFPLKGSVKTETGDVFRNSVFGPLFRAVVWLAERLRWIQQGRNQLYVLYIALTLLILLVWKLGVTQ